MTVSKALKIFSLSLVIATVFLTSNMTRGQDDDDSAVKSTTSTKNSENTDEEVKSVPGKKPFTAKLEVDTPSPVTFGDDLDISISIIPDMALQLDSIQINPKGELSSLYGSASVSSDTSSSTKEITCNEPEEYRLPEGVPFVVRCNIKGTNKGWDKWLDWNMLIGSGQRRFEAKITFANGTQVASTYYESLTVNFISSKLTVILGGFSGALLWAIFLAVSAPPNKFSDVPIRSWKEFLTRAMHPWPQATYSFIRGTFLVSRSTMLGGVCALVLIIMAQTTEGFGPPISIRIQDFWGGLMVGILSVPLSKWIREKLSGAINDSSATAKSPPQNVTPPNPPQKK